MKVGILTFHLGQNHGGFLQAYCLQSFLKKHGHDVRVINYKNKNHHYIQDVLPWYRKQKPTTWLRHFSKWRVFLKDQRLLEKTGFTTNPEALSALDFDRVVVGSDIVWSQDLFGFDPVYFGKVPCEKLISYAASFGWMPENTILPAGAVEGLKSFHTLLVRDRFASKIVKNNTGRDAEMVIDPTLLDFHRPMVESGYAQDPVMLVYAYSLPDSWKTAIVDFAKSHGLRIEIVGYQQKIPGARFLNVGPIAWVEKFRKAKVIVTNTFHGSIYGVLSGHPFVSVWDDKSKDKIVSLFSQIGCEERLCKEPDNLSKLFENPLTDQHYEVLRRLSAESGNSLLKHLAE